MKYEDMSMPQLKSLCRDKGLGTGRSKSELIDKLVSYDNRVNQVADIDLTEDQIDTTVEEAESVVIQDAHPEDENPSPTIYRVKFSHVGPLLDTEHESFRYQTWELAKQDGYTPYGGPTGPRLNKVENGFLHYEVEVH